MGRKHDALVTSRVPSRLRRLAETLAEKEGTVLNQVVRDALRMKIRRDLFGEELATPGEAPETEVLPEEVAIP